MIGKPTTIDKVMISVMLDDLSDLEIDFIGRIAHRFYRARVKREAELAREAAEYLRAGHSKCP